MLRSQALETLLNPLNLTWPFTKDSQNLLWGLLCNLPEPVEPDLALHQSLPDLLREPSPEPCWTWPGSAANLLRSLLRNPVQPDPALHQSLPDLLRNLLRNPVEPKASHNLLQNLLRNPLEPDPALHQSLPNLLRELSPEPLLNLTWLCTFSGTFSVPEPCWTWPGSAPKPPSVEPDLALHQSLSPEPPDPVEPDLALHRSLPEPSLELSPELCWTWAGSAPKPPRPSRNLLRNPVEPDLALHQSLPNLLRNLLWNTLLNLTWLCTKASCNLLRNLLRNPVEPDLALHQSLPNLLRNLLWNTLLNLTWLCTKASCNLLRNLLRNPVEPDLALHQSLLDLLRNLRNRLRNLVEPDPAPVPVHTGASLGWSWRPH